MTSKGDRGSGRRGCATCNGDGWIKLTPEELAKAKRAFDAQLIKGLGAPYTDKPCPNCLGLELEAEEAKQNAMLNSTGTFGIGDKVQHLQYGEGTVLEVSGGGRGRVKILTVKFGRKKTVTVSESDLSSIQKEKKKTKVRTGVSKKEEERYKALRQIRDEEKLTGENQDETRSIDDIRATKFGNLVCEELFGGKRIRIFEFGFIQIIGSIEGLFSGDNALFEKLLSVSSSYGHKGDDAYLVVVTEIKTHTLIGNVGRRGWIHDYDHEIRSMHALTAAAKAVLEHPGPRELSRSGLSEVSTDVKTSISIADEIAKLVKLRDSGALTDEEFQTLKKKLL
jgi:hypothetical protein